MCVQHFKRIKQKENKSEGERERESRTEDSLKQRHTLSKLNKDVYFVLNAIFAQKKTDRARGSNKRNRLAQLGLA